MYINVNRDILETLQLNYIAKRAYLGGLRIRSNVGRSPVGHTLDMKCLS